MAQAAGKQQRIHPTTHYVPSHEKPGPKRTFQSCLHNAAQAASSTERRQPPFRSGRSPGRGRDPARPRLSPTEAPAGAAAAPAALTEGTASPSRQALPQEGARRGTRPRLATHLGVLAEENALHLAGHLVVHGDQALALRHGGAARRRRLLLSPPPHTPLRRRGAARAGGVALRAPGANEEPGPTSSCGGAGLSLTAS